MTTTPIATHDHAPEATTAPEEQAVQTRRSRFVFGGFLAVAAFFTGLALFLFGNIGLYGPIPYPWLAGLIIGVFNIAIMIYPIVQARTHKAQAKVRTIVAIAAILVGFIVTPIAMWLGQMIVGDQNGNAVNYVLGGIAPFVNAIAAFALAYITPAQRSIIPDLEVQLEVARTTLARRHQEWTDARAEVDALTTSRNTKKEGWESLNTAAQAAEKLVKKASKVLKKADVSKELTEANRAHPLAEQALTDHLAEIAEDKKLAKAGLSEEVREAAKERLVDLNRVLPEKEVAVQEALSRMKQAKRSLEASPEFAALDARTEESVNANKLRDATQKEVDKIEKQLTEATNTISQKGDLHARQQAEVARLTDKMETARRNDGNMLRDVVAVPSVALVLAVIFYPGWYIWVETTLKSTGL